MRAVVPAFLLLLTLAGCGESRRAEAPPASAPAKPEPVTSATRFPMTVAGASLSPRLAITDRERSTGLSGTKSLAAGDGILFLYTDDDRRAFWMPGVPYDIDIGFFRADGVLDQVVRLKAEDLTIVPSASFRIRFALETPAGWYAANGVRPGARLDLTALRAAIAARGYRHADFIP